MLDDFSGLAGIGIGVLIIIFTMLQAVLYEYCAVFFKKLCGYFRNHWKRKVK